MGKCPVCGRRANGLDIVCKCGQTFCMVHRMPEDHHCSFDYKQFERNRLMTEMERSNQSQFLFIDKQIGQI
jgi:predicted nucleic acid binding AN1-type Zn finger protein